MKRIYFFLTTSLYLLTCLAARAEQLTIVYPDVKAPYDKIFDQINSGIESEFNGHTKHLKLPAKFDATAVARSIVSDKVIALGKRGMRIAKNIYKTVPVVVGALPIKPNGISGVSLMADPDILFDSVTQLAPKVKTITVLYTPASAWIMQEAEVRAKEKGLKLIKVEVKDIRNAVKTYNTLFENQADESNAIWLPLDPITANDRIIVPVILEKAWENRMVVFSSKPTHAKRGALFSAIPNNQALGKQLVRLVNNTVSDKPTGVIKPLDNIRLAVNLRTAAHLGYEYEEKERSRFALTYPK